MQQLWLADINTTSNFVVYLNEIILSESQAHTAY